MFTKIRKSNFEINKLYLKEMALLKGKGFFLKKQCLFKRDYTIDKQSPL